MIRRVRFDEFGFDKSANIQDGNPVHYRTIRIIKLKCEILYLCSAQDGLGSTDVGILPFPFRQRSFLLKPCGLIKHYHPISQSNSSMDLTTPRPFNQSPENLNTHPHFVYLPKARYKPVRNSIRRPQLCGRTLQKWPAACQPKTVQGGHAPGQWVSIFIIMECLFARVSVCGSVCLKESDWSSSKQTYQSDWSSLKQI